MRLRPTRGRAGLTFLELLLAVSVSGLILAASSQMLFSMAHFWQEVELEPRFSHHVDGVSSLIQYCFDESAGLSRDPARRYGWDTPPGTSGRLFHFRLDPAPPVFFTEVLPTPPVDAWLVFDEDQGLSLLWHVPAVLTEGKAKLCRTRLSAWVEDVEIGYFDPERNLWEYESYAVSSKEKRSAPQGLRIVFNQNGHVQTRYFRMLRQDRHVLIY